jgi:hypothetical protein
MMAMLYEVLKTAKMGAGKAPDLYTALLAKNLRRDGEVKTLSGAPPLSFKANGQPLLDYLISGNTVQSGTPTPANPVDVVGVGTLDSGQYKIPISSSSTTTPVYLGDVETTRKIKKFVLTGQESFVEAGSGGIFRLTLDGYLRESDNVPYCTHYEGESPVGSVSQVSDLHIAFLISASGNNYLYIHDDTYINSVTNFIAYLAQQYAAGTPVTVWYVLATEETAVVNEPLMKIGEYADTVSKEQAGVEIPTARGTNTLDVLTDVKPSNVYLKYKEV